MPSSSDLVLLKGTSVPHHVIAMPSDGACLFASLSFALHGVKERAPEVREQLVNHVCEHWADFQCKTVTPLGGVYATVVDYSNL